MVLQPGAEGQDLLLLRFRPAFGMNQGAVKLLDLATRFWGAGMASQQATGRRQALGVGGLEHVEIRTAWALAATAI